MSGNRVTVGIITPHAAAGPEVELPAMTRGRVTAVVSRARSTRQVPARPRGVTPSAHDELRSSIATEAIERAAETFGDTSITAVAHASTTTGYVLGPRAEATLVERLTDRFEVRCVASCAAATAALRAHDVEHVQLVHPPWFTDDLDELGAAYFRSQGFDAVMTKAVDLPGDPADIRAKGVADWVARHVESRAEAIYLAGNGFRAVDAIEELERSTGRLVLQANQALLWDILRAVDGQWAIRGYGRALETNRADARDALRPSDRHDYEASERGH